MPTGSAFVKIKESVCNAAIVANNEKAKHEHHENEYSKYPYTTVFSTLVAPMHKACVYVRSGTRGVQLITLHENSVKKYQALVIQDIVKVALAQPFITKTARWSNWLVPFLKKINVANCLEAPTSWMEPRDFVSLTHATVPKDSVNAAQIYKAPESKGRFFVMHHQLKQKDAVEAENHWTETVQFSKKYKKWNPDSIKLMQEYESI